MRWLDFDIIDADSMLRRNIFAAHINFSGSALVMLPDILAETI